MVNFITFSPWFFCALGVIILCLPDSWARASALFTAGLSLFVFIGALSLSTDVPHFPHYAWVSSSTAWFSDLGLFLQYQLNGFNLIFILLITGIGSLIFFYAYFYMQSYQRLNQFFCYFTVFLGAMLGIVSSDNLLLLLLFWELTTLSSYFLISFRHEQSEVRKLSRLSLFTTALGGLALLLAIALIQVHTHCYSLSALSHSPAGIAYLSQDKLIAALIIFAAMTKSAQFPFHYWLPGAMAAPTPVSAFLHSATMVNAGIYLLASLHYALSSNPIWYPVVTTVGLLTMCAGAFLSIKESDVKRILAYTTVFALGYMVYLLAPRSPAIMAAFVIFLVVHALYKAALFLLAGYIDKSYGTRSLHDLGSLGKTSWVAALILIISAGSMASIPPFFGFLGKQLAFEAKLMKDGTGSVLEWVSFAASILIALQAFRLIFRLLRAPKSAIVPKSYTSLLWSPLILSIVTVILGLFKQLSLSNHLLHLSLESLTQKKLVWASNELDFGQTSFALTVLVFVGGLMAYAANRYFSRLAKQAAYLDRFGPEALCQMIIDNVGLLAKPFIGLFQNGRLVRYVYWTWACCLGLLFWACIDALVSVKFHLNADRLTLVDIILVTLTFISVLPALYLRSVTATVTCLGFFGLMIALIFLLHGAPDVAIAQVLAETLIVIFFVFNLYRLPSLKAVSVTQRRSLFIWRCVVSVFAGVLVSLTCLMILSQQFPTIVSNWYLQHSLPLGHGRNVVNVILVDFRALDTLGETIVVLASAVGVIGLIHKFGKK